MNMEKKRMDREEYFFAWFAGFVDGEGCITIRIKKQRNNSLSPRMTINNTCLEALMGIRLRIGGRISKGRIRVPRYKKSWMWELTNLGELKALLVDLLPYLQVKQKQAELVLDFPRSARNHRDINIHVQQMKIYKEMKKLNKTGRRIK